MRLTRATKPIRLTVEDGGRATSSEIPGQVGRQGTDSEAPDHRRIGKTDSPRGCDRGHEVVGRVKDGPVGKMNATSMNGQPERLALERTKGDSRMRDSLEVLTK